MKTLVNTGRPVVMTTNREPLDLQLSIKQRSGDPLTQTQNMTDGSWVPDRSLSPLVLDPDIRAYDPEKKAFVTVGTGGIDWYVNKIQDWNGTTGEGKVGASGTGNYSLEYVSGRKTGSVVVSQNVNYTSPVTLICVVDYTDTSRAENYRVQDSVMLTTENSPDEFYSVKINAPSAVEYRPFTDATSTRTLNAVTYKGNTIQEFPYTNGIKYFWYYLNAGAWTLIPTNGTYAPYVSGQNTATLTLDAAYIEHDTIKVMIAKDGTYTAVASPSGNPKTNGYFEVNNGVYFPSSDTSVAVGKTYYSLTQTKVAPDCDALSQIEVLRVLPRIEALPYCTGGSAINVGDRDREFKAILSMDAVDMSDALRNEYILLHWKSKPTNNNTVTDRGWGHSVSIQASSLMNTGNVNSEVYCDIGVLGPLELLVDDSPGGSGYVTDNSGSSSASQNSGYVVGRN